MKKLLIVVFMVCFLFVGNSFAAYTGVLPKDCTIVTLNAFEASPCIWVTWDGLGRNVQYPFKADSENLKVVYSVLLTAVSLGKTVRLSFDNGYITGVQMTP